MLILESLEVVCWCYGMFINYIKGLVFGKGNWFVMCDDCGWVLGLIDLYWDDGDWFFGVFEGVDFVWFEGCY